MDVMGPNPANNLPPLQGHGPIAESGGDFCATAPPRVWHVEQPIQLMTRRLNAYGVENRDAGLAGMTEPVAIEQIAANEFGRPTRYAMLDRRGVRTDISAEALRRVANYAGQGLAAPKQPLSSSNFSSITIAAGKMIFDGSGNGHGVGLCQYGAQEMAKAGKTWREILAWYYPGADIVQAYS